jgi:glutathione reductase (NADPH)
VAIMGGGYIAVEFAGLLAGLGAEVTLLYRGEKFLRGFDEDLRDGLAAAMAAGGITLRFNTTATEIERVDPVTRLYLNDGATLEVDALFLCTGRRPHLAGLNLGAAGVVTTRGGAIQVDAGMATSAGHIFALGDVTDQLNLTPVATAQGHALADTLFGAKPRTVSLANVPTAVFSTPPMATVGLTEAEAAQRGPAEVYLTSFTPMRHTISKRARRTMMKLVVDEATQKVLGAHMLGEDAPEIMQGIGVALVAGATKADFDRTIGIHPTAAEEFVTLRTRTRKAQAMPAPQAAQ